MAIDRKIAFSSLAGIAAQNTNVEPRLAKKLPMTDQLGGQHRPKSRLRPRTKLELPVYLYKQELADMIDPLPRDSSSQEEAVPSETQRPTESIHLGDSKWSARIKDFVDTLPIRNYARDFALWDMSREDVWRRYQLLPEPRCSSISRTALRFVLDTIARERPRTKQGMERYISIINEMTTQPVPIVPRTSEWTAAMSFVGRSHKYPRNADLDKCLALWDEMENRFGKRANTSTFNVILDVATKARKWQRVESVLAEMKHRGVPLDRYTWTTLIQGAGYRKDGERVRKTARMMSQGKEVVDVYMINCIMGAYIRSGKPEEAERLFNQIRRLTLQACSEADPLAPGYVENGRTSPMKKFSSQVPTDTPSGIGAGEISRTPYYLSPDVASFAMLLDYHCTTTGDFSRVTALLEDMELFQIRDSVAIFGSLFLGFAAHGGRNPAWSLGRLNYVFETLLRESDVKVTQHLARLAVRAYGVLGTEALVMSAWRDLDELWQAQGGDSGRRSSNILQELAIAQAKARASRNS